MHLQKNVLYYKRKDSPCGLNHQRKGVFTMEEKKVNVWKIIIISAGVAAAVAAVCITAYKLFKKYFKITFDCGEDCDSCIDGCFSDDFDDEDFIPECSIDGDDITVETAGEAE